MTDVRAKGWSDKLRFPVSFNYLTAMPPAVQVNETEYQIADIANHQARLDLTLSVYDDDALTLCFNYQQAAFNAEEITALSQQYHHILMDIVQPNATPLYGNP
nr:hypothetical protein PJ912_17225 [Pectobacterium colocasium]